MGIETKIEWCDHTFNPWWGCVKIDPECKNCYAASFAKRTGHAVWGGDAPRRFFGPKHWAEPVKWNREAERAGERRRVFCASMADVFENPIGPSRFDMIDTRARLFDLIEETTHLDWLLLTKRPELVTQSVPISWWDAFPLNVFMGTTGGCQATIDDNVPALLEIPAVVHFLSAEPLLGPVDILRYLHDSTCAYGGDTEHRESGIGCTCCAPREVSLDWVITGAESGGGARPMEEAWVRSLRDQCRTSGTSFFYKQKLDGKKHKVSLPILDGQQHSSFPELRS